MSIHLAGIFIFFMMLCVILPPCFKALLILTSSGKERFRTLPQGKISLTAVSDLLFRQKKKAKPIQEVS